MPGPGRDPQAILILEIERPNGARAAQGCPLDARRLCEIIRGLAPFVPADATWTVRDTRRERRRR